MDIVRSCLFYLSLKDTKLTFSGEDYSLLKTQKNSIMKSVCVFCGSSRGIKDIYSEKAVELADAMLNENMELVYGGANIGLMKIIADRMLDGNGIVKGVMPGDLAAREILHEQLTESIMVKDLQERKKVMDELSDGFITMPGGFGTIDELFEVLSWNQLGIIHKPVGIYNVDQYYDHLIAWLDHGVEEKFIRPEHRANIIADDDPIRLLEKMQNSIGNGDAGDLRIAAHSLKSNSADLGADTLRDLCKDAELMGRQEEMDNADTKVALIAAEYEKLESVLATIRNEIRKVQRRALRLRHSELIGKCQRANSFTHQLADMMELAKPVPTFPHPVV